MNEGRMAAAAESDVEQDIVRQLQDDIGLLMNRLVSLSCGKPNVANLEFSRAMWTTAKLLEENANLAVLEPYVKRAIEALQQKQPLLDGLLTLEQLKNASGLMRDLVLANAELPEEDAVKFCEVGLSIAPQPWRPSCVSEIVMSLSKAQSLLVNPFTSPLRLRLALAAYDGCSGDNDDDYRAWIVQSFCSFMEEFDDSSTSDDDDMLALTQFFDVAERHPRLCHALAIAIKHAQCLNVNQSVLSNIVRRAHPHLSNEIRIILPEASPLFPR